MGHMIGCFFILGIGLLLGLMSLFGEVFKSKKSLKLTAGAIQFSSNKHLTKWDKLKLFYQKVNQGSLYSSWINTTNNLVATQGRNATKLQFNYPNIKKEEARNLPVGWGDPNRARNLNANINPNINGNINGNTNTQFANNVRRAPSVFGNKEQQTVYNSKDNYNYFSYDPIKSNYKNNFGMQ